MKNELISNWTYNKIIINTIDHGIAAILMLKQELGTGISEEQKFLIDYAIDTVIYAVWELAAMKKKYKEFKKDYLEKIKERIKQNSEP